MFGIIIALIALSLFVLCFRMVLPGKGRHRG